MRCCCAFYGLFVLSAGFFSFDLCSAQTYAGFNPPNKEDEVDGARDLMIRKASGETISAPKLTEQVGFEDVRISADGHRIGWLTLMPNDGASYPVPLKLVIFRGDKIELVVSEGTCLGGWTFLENGAQVAYVLETCHFSTGKDAELRDTQYGGVLSKYALKRVDGDIPPDSLRRAPAWVREIPDIDR